MKNDRTLDSIGSARKLRHRATWPLGSAYRFLRRTPWPLGSMVALVASAASAEPMRFDLEDPAGRNAVSLTIESRYQPLRGFCDRVRGDLNFDPTTGACSGTIVLMTEAIHFAGTGVDSMFASTEWFDFITRPQLRLTIKASAAAERLDEETWQIDAIGAMVLRGRAGGVDFPLTVTYLPGGLSERSEGAGEGDLVVLRGRLSFPRDDFGVHPDPTLMDLWGNEVEMEFSLVGWASANTEP